MSEQTIPALSEDFITNNMQSDIQLWEKALTQETDETLTKTVTLPYGIGVYSLTFERPASGEQRRFAAATWAESIRTAINDVIGEDAVTARAAQAPARSSESNDSINSSGGTGAHTEAGGTQAVEGSVPSLGGFADHATECSYRLDAIRDEIMRTQKKLADLKKEQRALSAYMEVINAQENDNQEQFVFEEETT